MQVSKISNQNFGQFIKWEVAEGIIPNKRDRYIMRNIENFLNQTPIGKNLRIYGKLGNPNPNHPDFRYVRLQTYPLHEDITILKSYNADARSHDYTRKSLWFSIKDRFFTERIVSFIKGQSRYINYCVTHSEHSLARQSTQIHSFL